MTAERLHSIHVRAAQWFGRHARLTIGIAVALAIGGVVGAARLTPDTSPDTLVDRSSATYRATHSFQNQFGSDPVYVLVEGNLNQILLSADIVALSSLEGCIAGNRPAKAPAPKGVCSELARFKPAKVVYGPATFINQAAVELGRQFDRVKRRNAVRAAKAAVAARRLALAEGKSPEEAQRLRRKVRELAYAGFVREALRLALRYGLRSVPALTNPEFVSRLVFQPERGAAKPKTRFAYLFPSSNSALIQVRLRSSLSSSQRKRAVALIVRATEEKGQQLDHGSYVVAGVEPLSQSLTSTLTGKLRTLLPIALAVMVLTLALVFRSRKRLLPLTLALAAAAVTFGGLSLVGAGITMASIAVLPITLGLGIDYAIQYQARFNEAFEGGRAAQDALGEAARKGVPSIGLAAAASLAGLAVLLLSPLPLVKGFVALLLTGVVVSLICVFSVGSAVLVGPTLGLPNAAMRLIAPCKTFMAKLTGSAESSAASTWRLISRSTVRRELGARLATLTSWIGKQAIARPKRVLAIALAFAVVGWLADTQTETSSDIRDLVPQNLPALRNIQELQRSTGLAGEIDVTVKASDVTAPRVVSWLSRYEHRMLASQGYDPNKGCRVAKLCPGFSLTRLLEGGGRGKGIKADQVRQVIGAVPQYFRQAFISGDRRTANLAFGVPVMSLDRQKELVDEMRSRLNAPTGVRAVVQGLPVLVAESKSNLDQGRRWLLFGGLLAVLAVLAVAYRRPKLALAAFIPIVLTTGWSALIIFLLRAPLNPMSATLGVLIVAISTEFSVIVSSRYRQERLSGASPTDALLRTYQTAGSAVRASAITATMGFAVLIASDIQMLRQFGVVTVIDLTVALVGVAIVLPAALVWSEGERWTAPGRLLDRDEAGTIKSRSEEGE